MATTTVYPLSSKSPNDTTEIDGGQEEQQTCHWNCWNCEEIQDDLSEYLSSKSKISTYPIDIAEVDGGQEDQHSDSSCEEKQIEDDLSEISIEASNETNEKKFVSKRKDDGSTW